jgi:hypothetical protein
MEKHGIATAAEVDIDTLADRLQHAVQMAGAWAHKP